MSMVLHVACYVIVMILKMKYFVQFDVRVTTALPTADGAEKRRGRQVTLPSGTRQLLRRWRLLHVGGQATADRDRVGVRSPRGPQEYATPRQAFLS